MSGEYWERFCVVGIGGHARTKLLPAIAENGQSLAGLVTRKPASEGELDPGLARFATVGEALDALPEDTVFVVASPPAVHFEQVMAILEAGRDVVVEKPAFITAAEAKAATDVSRISGALLVEGFMNRYTATHRHFLAQFASQRPDRIDFVFTIPQAPLGTFRSDPAIGASNLFDMGCYLLGALSDAGLKLDGLQIEQVAHAGTPDRELLDLSGGLDGVKVRARIGVDTAYANRLTLTAPDGASIAYAPFIYGRPGERQLIRTRDGAQEEVRVDDCNAFAAMFSVSRDVWRDSQAQRSVQIVELAAHLERLGNRLAAARSA